MNIGPRNVFIDESEKDRLDIYAQEGMWRAANFLLIVTLVTFVVSAFALLFLYKTFRAQSEDLSVARESLKAAKLSNILELRPYLSIKDVEVEANGLDYHCAGFRVSFVISNDGETQARNFRTPRQDHASMHLDMMKPGHEPHHLWKDNWKTIPSEWKDQLAFRILNPGSEQRVSINFGVAAPFNSLRPEHFNADGSNRMCKTISELRGKHQLAYNLIGSLIFDDIGTVDTNVRRVMRFEVSEGMSTRVSSGDIICEFTEDTTENRPADEDFPAGFRNSV